MSSECLALTTSAATEHGTGLLRMSTRSRSPRRSTRGGALSQTTAGMELATEQSDEELRLIPIIEVAFREDYWWSIPKEKSADIYKQWEAGKDPTYTWDFGGARKGGMKVDGEETSINQYRIDFLLKQQINIDNGRKRTIRLIWIEEEDTKPRWTGQIQRIKEEDI